MMKIRYKINICLLLLTTLLFISCGDDDNSGTLLEQVTGLTPANDVSLGRDVVAQIESDPSEYPILSESDYPEAYEYLNAMRGDILSSDDINYTDLFPYTFTIIERDDVLNAFATPGGFMYVYTGLIKYLDNADDLAGVLGHEIAHASERHSVDQMKQNLGLQFLVSVALGDGSSSQIGQMVSGFFSLSFSRSDESEADEFSVAYLGDTDYACNGAAKFFEKLEEEGQCQGSFAILSTHPDPCDRVDEINALANSNGCSTDLIAETGMTYNDFKSSLP